MKTHRLNLMKQIKRELGCKKLYGTLIRRTPFWHWGRETRDFKIEVGFGFGGNRRIMGWRMLFLPSFGPVDIPKITLTRKEVEDNQLLAEICSQTVANSGGGSHFKWGAWPHLELNIYTTLDNYCSSVKRFVHSELYEGLKVEECRRSSTEVEESRIVEWQSRKKSKRILLKTTFSKFTNEESNPLLIDIEDEDNQGNEIVQPRIRREGQKKCSTPKKKTKKQSGGDDD
ncbi:unnamed protein product [Lactuca saligna]|uniref:Uncharacterized protein n=1 Tax=Lactuca saligna TaxID=75948 RepID=A0AA35UKQ8_LACSI|nr:unnamed protein product [Lactuca saligna]